MMQRLRKLPPPLKMLAVAVAAIVSLALAAGVGAMAALTFDPGPGPSAEQPEGAGGAGHQREAGTDEGAPDRPSEAEYIDTVGDIQAEAVEAFMDSHDKLLRYDALTAG